MGSGMQAAWKMSNEANLFLLRRLPPGGLTARYGARTRTVAAQFAHLHDVRLRWLAHAAPELAKGLAKLGGKDSEPTGRELEQALKTSEAAIARFLEACEQAGKVKAWKGPPETFLAYLVAHEGHHRGLALAALRAAGHKLPQEVVYGLWDWGKRSSRR